MSMRRLRRIRKKWKYCINNEDDEAQENGNTGENDEAGKERWIFLECFLGFDTFW